MPSNHLIVCRPLLLLPSNFPGIRVFSKGLALLIRWSKYWSFSFSIRPSSEYSGLISFKLYKPSSINKRRHGDWNAKLFICRISASKALKWAVGWQRAQTFRKVGEYLLLIIVTDLALWYQDIEFYLKNYCEKWECSQSISSELDLQVIKTYREGTGISHHVKRTKTCPSYMVANPGTSWRSRG